VAAEETPHCDCTYQDEATCDSKLWCARWEHSLNNFTVLAHSNGFCRTQENNQ
jgi:hypothetical protein